MDQQRIRQDSPVIRVVSDATSPAAIDLMREYMTITQIESFGTAELPAALAAECEHAARVYAAPGAWFVAYDGDAAAGCVGVRRSPAARGSRRSRGCTCARPTAGPGSPGTHGRSPLHAELASR